jgi:hypothetical protein
MVTRKKSSPGFLPKPTEEDEVAEVQPTETFYEENTLPVVIEPLEEDELLPEIVPQPMPERIYETPEPAIAQAPVKQSVRHRNVPRLSRVKK